MDAWINVAAFHSNLALRYYPQVLSEEKLDLIHTHFGYDAVKLIRLSKVHHIPLVVSFYGTDVSRLPTKFGWKRRYHKLASKASHFIAATEFKKSQLVDLGFPEHKVSIVRFGVDLNGSIHKEPSC